VHPREVFADPITDRACAIIVAHNHPSGKLEPSNEDLDITRRLRQSGEILGIPVLDHLVFSENGYFSFAEHGLIGETKDN
jgi:DNA repair protein RadC